MDLLNCSVSEPHHPSSKANLPKNHRRDTLTQFQYFGSESQFQTHLLQARQLLSSNQPFSTLTQQQWSTFTICLSSCTACPPVHPWTKSCKSPCLCQEKPCKLRLPSFCRLDLFRSRFQGHSCTSIFPLKSRAHLLHWPNWWFWAVFPQVLVFGLARVPFHAFSWSFSRFLSIVSPSPIQTSFTTPLITSSTPQPLPL